jgi:hypothetical protein
MHVVELIIHDSFIVSANAQNLQYVIHSRAFSPSQFTCNTFSMNLTLPAAFVDRLSQLSAGATKTYLSLVWLKATQTPYPTQPDIANHINASERSVITYLKELEEAGYIEKRKIGGGRRTDYMIIYKHVQEHPYGKR